VFALVADSDDLIILRHVDLFDDHLETKDRRDERDAEVLLERTKRRDPRRAPALRLPTEDIRIFPFVSGPPCRQSSYHWNVGYRPI
jgi:hypothetical protein